MDTYNPESPNESFHELQSTYTYNISFNKTTANFKKSEVYEEAEYEIPNYNKKYTDLYETRENSNPSSKKWDPIRNHNEISYETLLMRLTSSDRLIERFELEKNYLRPSDAAGCTFDIDSCIERLKAGYTVLLFDYDFYKFCRVVFRADEEGILIEKSERKSERIGYHEFLGVLLGDESSTFVMYKSQIGSIEALGLDSTDCFSLIGPLKNYDFATPSDRAKYDIYLVLAWHINTNSNFSSTIPLTKFGLTKMIVKKKLQKMAEERKLYVHELFLLAIMKSLILLNKSQEAYELVKKKLDYIVHADSKIYRMCFKIKPKHYKASKIFQVKFNDEIRMLFLMGRFASRVNKADAHRLELKRKWQLIKESHSCILSLPSIKEELKKKKFSIVPDKTSKKRLSIINHLEE